MPIAENRSDGTQPHLVNIQFIFLECRSPCKTCIGNKGSMCLSCLAEGHVVYNYKCITECPYHYVNINGFCQSKLFIKVVCHDECGNCGGLTRTMCISCEKDKVLFNGQCLSECPFGYFMDNDKCLACEYPCETCTFANKCITCVSNFYKIGDECVRISQCPEGKYADSMTLNCEPCSVGCLTCYGPENSDCLKCNYLKGYQRNEKNSDRCNKVICSEGSYLFIDYNKKSVSCFPCHISCKSCYSSEDCIECKSGLINKENSLCSDCPKEYTMSSLGKCKGDLYIYYRNLR